MRKHLGLVAALLGAGTFLMAGSSSAQEKYYVGGSLGQSKSDTFCKDANAGGLTRCDDNATAWRFLGGYQMNRNLGFELGYGELARLTASGGATRVDVKASTLEG